MAITSALVLFAVIWFMALFVALPIGQRSQHDEGVVVPGTHEGAPVDLNLKRKFMWVTAVTVVLWSVSYVLVVTDFVSVRTLDWFGRMGPTGGTGA
ncbi:Predicted secreted protein [Tranquillimonas rosea]|uniref:Predicted secreted protein n=1 Tax=Tranquillimonas rosea TaxID=641238 RepID=A0A1H9RND0_9RHOB|nr:DUF1467 family protein [Tranquillimonas rosea]SER73985.1 Predicted secreted protein [Tranquillimonas rosea]